MNESETPLYAKVEDGVVIEFPVTLDVIKNRGHAVFQYVQVSFDTPAYYNRDIERLGVRLDVEGNRVIARQVKIALTAEELFTSFKDTEGNPRDVETLSTEAINTAKTYIINYAETKVDQLVQQRGYSSLTNILSRYTNSTNEKYRKEALFAQKVLDDAWGELEAYFEKILTKQADVPTSFEDVDAILKLPTWADFDKVG